MTATAASPVRDRGPHQFLRVRGWAGGRWGLGRHLSQELQYSLRPTFPALQNVHVQDSGLALPASATGSGAGAGSADSGAGGGTAGAAGGASPERGTWPGP